MNYVHTSTLSTTVSLTFNVRISPILGDIVLLKFLSSPTIERKRLGSYYVYTKLLYFLMGVISPLRIVKMKFTHIPFWRFFCSESFMFSLRININYK